GQCPTGLRDDVRHGQAGFAAGFRERVDAIIRVLLHGVVHAGRDRGAGAVVVDAQAAANIHVRDVHAGRTQFAVEARDLLQPRFDVADVGDLRSEMKMDELEHVLATGGLQPVHDLDQFARVQPELGLLATAFRPAPESLRRELDAYTSGRLHVHFVRDAQQRLELRDLFDHDEDLMAELLAHQGEAHELLVLVAVAHDHVIYRLAQRKNGLQLGLAAAFETDAVGSTPLHDLLDDVPLLVHLDRIHQGVAVLVAELRDGALESGAQRLD